MLQAFVEPAMECAVPPERSLNFLHQSAEPLSILARDEIFDRYRDRPIFVLRRDWKVMQWIERSGINARFGGEVY